MQNKTKKSKKKQILNWIKLSFAFFRILPFLSTRWSHSWLLDWAFSLSFKKSSLLTHTTLLTLVHNLWQLNELTIMFMNIYIFLFISKLYCFRVTKTVFWCVANIWLPSSIQNIFNILIICNRPLLVCVCVCVCLWMIMKTSQLV